MDFWKNSLSTVLVLSTTYLAMPSSKAATTVPTIRIEIPKKDTTSTEQNKSTSPTIPLDEDDLTPSINGFDDEVFPDEQTEPEIKADELEERAPAKVFYGDKDLPKAVKVLRLKLIDIAHSGEIEKLRPLLDSFKEPPLLSFQDEGDPIEFLKTSSGDGEGREILAILLEVLESGYVRRNEDNDGDIYIWPYFVEIPPDDLTSRQIVELFRIITAGDFEDMKAYGTYIFYRVGITPDGELKFFVAGD